MHTLAFVAGQDLDKILEPHFGEYWDWYEIGGRWHEHLVSSEGTRCNSCTIIDLNLELTTPPNYLILPEGGIIEIGEDKVDKDAYISTMERLLILKKLTVITAVDLHY